MSTKELLDQCKMHFGQNTIDFTAQILYNIIAIVIIYLSTTLLIKRKTNNLSEHEESRLHSFQINTRLFAGIVIILLGIYNMCYSKNRAIVSMSRKTMGISQLCIGLLFITISMIVIFI